MLGFLGLEFGSIIDLCMIINLLLLLLHKCYGLHDLLHELLGNKFFSWLLSFVTFESSGQCCGFLK